MRIPFFGLISLHSPLVSILEHYDQVVKGMDVIEAALAFFVNGKTGEPVSKEFNSLLADMDVVEAKGDTITRYIRNHLPSSLFLPVDKHVFFSYTRKQDNILNAGQDILHWMALRDTVVPELVQKDFTDFVGSVSGSVRMLRPAIEATLAWVDGEGVDRDTVKQKVRAVRVQHTSVTEHMHRLLGKIYRSDLDLRDIYQLIRLVERMHKMSHRTEDCVDLLRVMIAK
jgi:predicted phosphate transport protein (TIGR00153 family)